MLRTYVYVQDELEKQLLEVMRTKSTSKAQVIRTALKKGLASMKAEENESVDVLFKIRELGEKYKLSGPKNSSTRIDELLWDKYEV